MRTGGLSLLRGRFRRGASRTIDCVFLVPLAMGLALVLSVAPGGWCSGPGAEKKDVTIHAVGDIMMGSSWPEPVLPPEDGTTLFAAVAEGLRGADVVFGNLEAALSDSCRPAKCGGSKSGRCFEFVTPTRYAAHLRAAGFTLLNIANNHSLDCGVSGIEATISALAASGMMPCGGIYTGRFTVKGTRIEALCFSYRSDDYALSILDIPAAAEKIRTAKQGAEIVIVSFHGGAEGKAAQRVADAGEIFLGENRGNVFRFARAAVDAGADLVIGHGPHVLRAMEVYGGRLIAYSMGNFLGYKFFNVKGVSGISAILSVTLDARTGRFLTGRIIPVTLDGDGIPSSGIDASALGLLRTLSASDIQENPLRIAADGTLSVADDPR